MTRRTEARRELLKDILFIFLGIALTLLLAQTGALKHIPSFLGGEAWGSFIAGVLFTSAFTLAPASVALVHIAETTPILTVAFWGALGAMCGDLILFLFIRDRFANDLKDSFRPSFFRHVMSSFHFGFLKWLGPIIGAIIIASPLPDELGLGLMGISKTRVYVLMPVAFVMNMIGIYILVWFAHAI